MVIRMLHLYKTRDLAQFLDIFDRDVLDDEAVEVELLVGLEGDEQAARINLAAECAAAGGRLVAVRPKIDFDRQAVLCRL